MSHYSLVAEHIIGWQRKPHQGTLGGGTVGTEGSETWIYCHWCHQRITPERLGEPCPAYQFPVLTLEELLTRLGELAVHVMLRVDPERLQNRYTVMLHRLRLPATDAPFELLIAVLGAVLAQDPLTPLAKQLQRLSDEDWVAKLELDLSDMPERNPTIPWPRRRTHTTTGNPRVTLDPAAAGTTGGPLPIEASSGTGASHRFISTTDLGSRARGDHDSNSGR